MSKIGIDFGTTNSSLVAYDSEKKKFDFFGYQAAQDKPIPSVVWYHDNKVDVGDIAKKNYNRYCDVPGHHMEKSIKSKLGTSHKISKFGELLEPYSVAAEVVEHLKDVAIAQKAEQAGVSLSSAVFTIPVGFTGRQRAELRKAAETAGIAIETFIHEPFAALIGYIYSEANMRESSLLNDSYVLVFDWGGGTLDITAVKVERERMYEVGTSELTGIAGDRFDNDLVDLVKNRFIDKYKSTLDPEVIAKMFEEKKDRIGSNAEQCKIALSTKLETEFYVESIVYDPNTQKSVDIDEKILRTDFEKCIQHHVDNAMNRVDETIKAAGISSEQISFVLMTGGSSNIPIIKAAIEDRFGSRVRVAKNPDMVIAQGAAVVAEMGWSPYLSKDIIIELSDGSYWSLFQKGLPLVREEMPAKEERFTCIDTRDTEAKVIIAEGTIPDTKDKNLAILNIPVHYEPSLRSPDDIIVEFIIDNNIILTARGYGLMEGKRKAIEIHNLCFGVEMR